MQRNMELTEQLRVNRRLANQTINWVFVQPALSINYSCKFCHW